MTLITLIEIATNHENGDLNVLTSEKDGKHACFLYLMRDGEIHKLMLSSDHIFDSEKDAEDYMNTTIDGCVEHYEKEIK